MLRVAHIPLGNGQRADVPTMVHFRTTPPLPITTTTTQSKMTNMQTELRSLTHRAIIATAALAPFTLGTGHDSHGDPVPNAEAAIRRGLLELAEAGRLAQVALDRSDAMERLPWGMPWLL
jgi:hypothetical protein